MHSGWLKLCLYPEVKLRILQHFIQNPELRNNQSSIAKSIQHTQIQISRHIRDLVQLKLLEEEPQGKSIVYSLNNRSILVNNLLKPMILMNRNLLFDWVEAQMSKLPKKYAKSVYQVLLFGSGARGELRVSSDIDLLVVVDKKESDLEFEVHSLFVADGNEVGLNINLQIETLRNFDHPKSKGYLSHAKAEGITLWRKNHEIRR